MSKTILKKEVTEYGSTTLTWCGHRNSCDDIIYFDSDSQFKAFAFLVKMMADTDAASVEVG